MSTRKGNKLPKLDQIAEKLDKLAEDYTPPVRSSSLQALEQLLDPIKVLVKKNASAVKVTEQLNAAGMDVSVHTVRRFLRKHDLIKGRKRRKS